MEDYRNNLGQLHYPQGIENDNKINTQNPKRLTTEAIKTEFVFVSLCKMYFVKKINSY